MQPQVASFCCHLPTATRQAGGARARCPASEVRRPDLQGQKQLHLQPGSPVTTSLRPGASSASAPPLHVAPALCTGHPRGARGTGPSTRGPQGPTAPSPPEHPGRPGPGLEAGLNLTQGEQAGSHVNSIKPRELHKAPVRNGGGWGPQGGLEKTEGVLGPGGAQDRHCGPRRTPREGNQVPGCRASCLEGSGMGSVRTPAWDTVQEGNKR